MWNFNPYNKIEKQMMNHDFYDPYEYTLIINIICNW